MSTAGREPPEAFPIQLRSEEGRLLYRLIQSFASNVLKAIAEVKTSVENLRSGIKLEIESLKEHPYGSIPPLPPARGESPSQAAFVEHATEGVKAILAERAKRTQGPNVDATPDEIAKLVEPVVASIFKARDDEANAKTVHRLRKLQWVAVGAFVTAVAGGAGAWVWGKAQGHAEGYSEAKSHAAASAHP